MRERGGGTFNGNRFLQSNDCLFTISDQKLLQDCPARLYFAVTAEYTIPGLTRSAVRIEDHFLFIFQDSYSLFDLSYREFSTPNQLPSPIGSNTTPVVVGNKAFFGISGGYIIFDLSSHTWSFSFKVGVDLSNATPIVFGQNIYTTTGVQNDAQRQIYHIETDSWTISAENPNAQNSFTFVYQDCLWFVSATRIWKLDALNNVANIAAIPLVRSNALIVQADGKIWIAGGLVNGKETDLINIYNIHTGEWGVKKLPKASSAGIAFQFKSFIAFKDNNEMIFFYDTIRDIWQQFGQQSQKNLNDFQAHNFGDVLTITASEGMMGRRFDYGMNTITREEITNKAIAVIVVATIVVMALIILAIRKHQKKRSQGPKYALVIDVE